MAAISKVYVILTQYFMCIYWGYMYMYLQDMKFLWAMLSLGQLYTDDNTNDNDNDDTNDSDNNTWWTNHDCIGSLACMPNEPISIFGMYVKWDKKCITLRILLIDA